MTNNGQQSTVYLIDLYKWAKERDFKPPLNFLPWMRAALVNGQTIIIRKTPTKTSVIGVHTSTILNPHQMKDYSSITENYLRSSGLSAVRYTDYLGTDRIKFVTPADDRKRQAAYRDACAVSLA